MIAGVNPGIQDGERDRGKNRPTPQVANPPKAVKCPFLWVICRSPDGGVICP